MNILFIGNSYTMNNDLPRMVNDLAQSKRKNIKTSIVARGGETFEGHYFNHESMKQIGKKDWDLIVLQENSKRPIESPELLAKYGQKLFEKSGNANTILYLTWARKYAPETQIDITNAYLELQKKIDAKIAPVGLIWEKINQKNTSLDLYTQDQSHPSFLGTYIAACTIYATIFNDVATGLTNNIYHSDGVSYVIDKSIAEFIQKNVDEGIQEFKKTY